MGVRAKFKFVDGGAWSRRVSRWPRELAAAWGCHVGAEGKESGTRSWELQDQDRWLRVRDPRVGSRGSPWKNGLAQELRARHGARPGSLDS
ncbi:hypothetical protein CRG98_041360 [Punica granatum]|uniref:Uncharacterized protein n=1 Tax=Punica granatum TaxID=22663 RepID=A0A2I0I2M9_PUNGR|nr:hypothetical protein CRG98_041360 [Punica granatum]